MGETYESFTLDECVTVLKTMVVDLQLKTLTVTVLTDKDCLAR